MDFEFDIAKLFGVAGEDTLRLPDPQLLQFYSDRKENHVWLDEEISWDTCDLFAKWLMAADRENTNEPIIIHIMSGGGELDIMFTLYDLIKNTRRPIITINEGRCHSAAFIIFLAGDTRLMRKYAQFIAHEGSGGNVGTFKEIEQQAKAHSRLVENMRNIVVEETKITKEQLKDHFDKESDWYIDYAQAKELGIIREAIVDNYIRGGSGNPIAADLGSTVLTIPGYAEV